ncbi:MAG: leucine-rich repeat domain-containing protein [Clostridia bacterium]|nr:leucine-rich repeat domain-containing protein [Clostridia bacterium]
MKRARLIVSIITCFFAVAVLCFGVFAAVNTGFSLGGQLEYEVNNAFVDIETKVYKYKQGITDVSTGTQLVDTLKDMTLENIEANKSRLNLASSSVSVPKYSTSTGQGSSLNSISLKYDEGHGFTYIVVINIQNEVADIPAYAVVNSVNPPQNSWYVDSSGQAKIEPGEKNKNIVIAFGLNDIKEEIETGSTFSYGIACGKYEASAALQYTTHAGQSSELPNSSNGGLAPQQSGAYVDISGIDTTKLDSSVLIIPDQYGGINVTTMSAQFADISTVTSVIFGKNMISTPDMSGFKNLVSVVFDGNQVTSMANFDRCLKLTSITVPASVTSLNLNGCTSLGGVIFKDGFAMTEFATATFKNCISLTGIKIPDTITTLKSELFNGCINLTTVHIPETVTKIEEYVFTQTKFLENLQADHNGIATSVNGTKQFAISVPTTVTNLNLLNTKVIARYALHGCTSITSVHLPVDLEFIGNYAFATWTNSQTIYQPNVAEYTPVIEPYAFANCNAVMGSHSGSSIVVFDTDGGDALENMQVPLSGSEQQIELPTPVKEGYALVEWQITTNTTPACRISNNKLIIPAAVLGQIELKATYKSAMGFLRSNWLTALGYVAVSGLAAISSITF